MGGGVEDQTVVSVVCRLDRSGRCRGPNSGERCMYTRQVGGGVEDQTVVSVVYN